MMSKLVVGSPAIVGGLTPMFNAYKKAPPFDEGFSVVAERPGLRPSGTHQSAGLTPMFNAYKKGPVFRLSLSVVAERTDLMVRHHGGDA
ncbi:hypothetical protein PTW35_25775 (plasmid) [Photobacterium sp. DA100]|uniref:hypothetical protein n=1 Tax=Photobacterium sp. DA100 TaxID=3027472 RepID=UPI002479C53C|nr:hypothetical protein [Photobacterium sp. DA100]WEM44671.1 hypothetical protein PTW35_25775 [Photobacterium sp. DA100]